MRFAQRAVMIGGLTLCAVGGALVPGLARADAPWLPGTLPDWPAVRPPIVARTFPTNTELPGLASAYRGGPRYFSTGTDLVGLAFVDDTFTLKPGSADPSPGGLLGGERAR